MNTVWEQKKVRDMLENAVTPSHPVQALGGIDLEGVGLWKDA